MSDPTHWSEYIPGAIYRRVGDQVEVHFQSTTPGPWDVVLPAGMKIDACKLAPGAKVMLSVSKWDVVIDEMTVPRLARRRRLAKFLGFEHILSSPVRTVRVECLDDSQPDLVGMVSARHISTLHRVVVPIAGWGSR